MIDAIVFGVPYKLDGGTLASGVFSFILAWFALGVGLLAKFKGPAKPYAVFGLAFGGGTLIDNLAAGFLLPYLDYASLVTDWGEIPARAETIWVVATAVQSTLLVVAALAVGGLMAQYGVDSPLRRVWYWVWPMAAGGLLLLLNLNDPGLPSPTSNAVAAMHLVAGFAFGIFMGWMGVAAVAMAQAYRRDRQVGQAILAAAMAAYPVFYGAAGAAGFTLAYAQFGSSINVWGPFVPSLIASSGVVMAVAWWRVHHATQSRAAWRVAILAAVYIAAGIGFGMTEWAFAAAGIARAFEVLLVAYAILRLQYLDLDVKLRWGISKTTVAAIFVAVFFIVSELAASIFSDRFGPVTGIVAAGGLVFGIAPIMRWADKLAATAVPAAGPTNWAEYETALRMALADGTVSPDEERMLADVADRLGLSAKDATELRLRLTT